MLVVISQTSQEENVNYAAIIDGINSVSRYGTSPSSSVSSLASSSSVVLIKKLFSSVQVRVLSFYPSPCEVSCRTPQRNTSSTTALWPRRPAARLSSGSSSRTQWPSLTNRWGMRRHFLVPSSSGLSLDNCDCFPWILIIYLIKLLYFFMSLAEALSMSEELVHPYCNSW